MVNSEVIFKRETRTATPVAPQVPEGTPTQNGGEQKIKTRILLGSSPCTVRSAIRAHARMM
jgi:hypothetical protein